ncbi:MULTISPECIES: hypothetical protein [unclassified Mesorhizobium]|uniref:hypothetical protein n=1 Tax=unclassified Mesorhizobium TaxID=325217 RepID=UPI001129B8A7|nr:MULTISPECIES: hypothetical protein [unclassified Mesorhizobium]TPJ54414.1 hypothetical protein FJ426_08955 [Mesorhizobium sp. B2-6-4]TPM98887.1 hypothetical protein FJ966_09185 [Mesorhizobium sp. B2-1-5]
MLIEGSRHEQPADGCAGGAGKNEPELTGHSSSSRNHAASQCTGSASHDIGAGKNEHGAKLAQHEWPVKPTPSHLLAVPQPLYRAASPTLNGGMPYRPLADDRILVT